MTGRVMGFLGRAPVATLYGGVRCYAHGALRTLDVFDGGGGRISDQVTSDGVPVSRRVRLIDRRSGRLIRETWSDPVSGAYAFERIATDRHYLVYALDHTGQHNAVIVDSVSAEPMP